MNFLAKRITLFFIKHKQIEQNEAEVYVYCFEILLSTVANALLLLVLAIVFRLYYETLIFSAVFIGARMCFGGFHAKTHFGCFAMLLVTYCIFMVGIKYTRDDLLNLVGVFMIAVCLFPVALLAPVSHPNNPLSRGKKQQLKWTSRLLVFALLAICLCLSFYQCGKLSFMFAYPCFCSAVTMILGAVLYREATESDENNIEPTSAQ